MLALTLGQAKAIAAAVVVVLLLVAVISAWVMKEAMQKVMFAAILGLLALLVWTQRSSLDDCSQRVRDQVAEQGRRGVDTTCSFFGQDITISTSGNDASS